MNYENATTTCEYITASTSVCVEQRSGVTSDIIFQVMIFGVAVFAIIIFYFRALRK